MYYIIFNPTAAAGRSAKTLERVEQCLKEKNEEYTVDHTEYPGHAKEMAAAAVGKGYNGILSVGGDGTLLEVAEALRGTDEVLGVIPAGTGNDFRQSIDVPKETGQAVDIVLNGFHRSVDIGLIDEEKCFLNVAGTGFDVDVIKNTNRVRRFVTGSLAYYLGIVFSIIGYKNTTINVKMNGETLRRTVLLVAVANGKCYGGGLQIGPNASVTDGLFNVVIINRLPKWRILLELPKLQRGDLDEIPFLEQYVCSEITIDCTKPHRLNMDGDIYGQTPTTLRVAGSALNVFCPQPPDKA